MKERGNDVGEDNRAKYIAFGVCFGLLIGTGIGVVASVLTNRIAIILPLMSGIGLLVGAFIGLHLASKNSDK